MDDREHPISPQSRVWLLRGLVWTVFAVVAYTVGPRALATLQSRVEGASRAGPVVEFGRVGYLARPEWMSDGLLVAVSRDLEPFLRGSAPILEEEPARELIAGLCRAPWVEEARLERAFPDKFRVRFGLRRPVLCVRDEDGAPLCLSDKHGVALPWVDGLDLPSLFLRREGGAGTMRGRLGEPAPDERVLAACRIAVEWRDELAPLVPGCPPLVEVDATNLGLRWARGPEYPEIRVMLRSEDGGRVVFGYGHPVDSSWPRVPVATKAKVLRAVLEGYPGLVGVGKADLRFENRWRSWLQAAR